MSEGKLNPKYWPSRKWDVDGNSKLCATPDDVPEGYADSPQEAALLAGQPAKNEPDAADNDDPAAKFWAELGTSREEVEAELNRRGVEFHPNIGDAKLVKRLQEVLAADEPPAVEDPGIEAADSADAE